MYLGIARRRFWDTMGVTALLKDTVIRDVINCESVPGFRCTAK